MGLGFVYRWLKSPDGERPPGYGDKDMSDLRPSRVLNTSVHNAPFESDQFCNGCNRGWGFVAPVGSWQLHHYDNVRDWGFALWDEDRLEELDLAMGTSRRLTLSWGNSYISMKKAMGAEDGVHLRSGKVYEEGGGKRSEA